MLKLQTFEIFNVKSWIFMMILCCVFYISCVEEEETEHLIDRVCLWRTHLTSREHEETNLLEFSSLSARDESCSVCTSPSMDFWWLWSSLRQLYGEIHEIFVCSLFLEFDSCALVVKWDLSLVPAHDYNAIFINIHLGEIKTYNNLQSVLYLNTANLRVLEFLMFLEATRRLLFDSILFLFLFFYLLEELTKERFVRLWSLLKSSYLNLRNKGVGEWSSIVLPLSSFLPVHHFWSWRE